MSSVYRASCEDCGYTSGEFPDVYHALWLDGPAVEPRDVSFSENGTEAHLVPLAHPMESRILAKHGHTLASAGLEGRLVAVQNVMCPQCGTISERRRLSVRGPGAWIAALFLALTAATVAAFSGFPVTVVAVIGIGGVTTFGMAARVVSDRYARARFGERTQALNAYNHCLSCGGNEAESITTLGRFPCPQCGEVKLRVRSVGIS